MSKTNYDTNMLDTEYTALRRRMSRLRVQGQHPSADDMDLDPGNEYYGDLLKFWKKHKIFMGKDVMSTVADAQARKRARQRGRRKSKEFEDLDVNVSTGSLSGKLKTHPSLKRFDSEIPTVPEDSEWTIKAETESPRGGSKKSQRSPKLLKKQSSFPSDKHHATVGSKNGSPKILRKTESDGAIKRQSSLKSAKAPLQRKISDYSKPSHAI